MSFKNSMNIDSIIVNNFLDDPDAVRSWVIDNSKNGFLNFDIEGSYPGKRTYQLANIDYRSMVESKLKQILPFKFEMDMKRSDSYAYQVCLENEMTWVHVDSSHWAGILYLTPNAPLESGTLIYREEYKPILNKMSLKIQRLALDSNKTKTLDDEDKISKEMDSLMEGSNITDVTIQVNNIYNRLLLLRGSCLPHRSNISGFGNSLENGRLTQVFFFNEVI